MVTKQVSKAVTSTVAKTSKAAKTAAKKAAAPVTVTTEKAVKRAPGTVWANDVEKLPSLPVPDSATLTCLVAPDATSYHALGQTSRAALYTALHKNAPCTVGDALALGIDKPQLKRFTKWGYVAVNGQYVNRDGTIAAHKATPAPRKRK